MEQSKFDYKIFDSKLQRNKYAFDNKTFLTKNNQKGLLISESILTLISIVIFLSQDNKLENIFSFLIWASVLSIPFFIKRNKIRKYSKLYEQYLTEIQKEQKIKERERLENQKQKEKFEKFQREKGLELFEGKWVGEKEIPKLKEMKIGLDNNFKDISPFEFEKFIAKLFTSMGYQTRVTQQTGDYGVDVIAKKDNDVIAIQVKKYHEGNPVGNRDVQRLLGAMQLKDLKANHGILVTTSHFTVQAKEQAKECPIELWDKHDLHKMVKKYLMNIE